MRKFKELKKKLERSTLYVNKNGVLFRLDGGSDNIMATFIMDGRTQVSILYSVRDFSSRFKTYEAIQYGDILSDPSRFLS